MNVRLLVGTFALALVASSALAQQNPLVGTWERTSETDAKGVSVQAPNAPAWLMLSADGLFVQVGVPSGRPKINKPVDQMTREELITTFNHVTARRGTYTVSSNRITRHNIAELNAQFEGHDQVQEFSVQGDTLRLTYPDPNNKSESVFRRVRGRSDGTR